MSGMIHPADVTKAGNAARHIADTMVKPACTELGSAEKDEGAAKLDGFASKGSLTSLLDAWQPTTSGLQTNVHDTGDKLVNTSNTYISTDNANIDLFKYIPPAYGNHKPMPR